MPAGFHVWAGVPLVVSGSGRPREWRMALVGMTAGLGFSAAATSADLLGLGSAAATGLIVAAVVGYIGAMLYIARGRAHGLGSADWLAIGYAAALITTLLLFAATTDFPGLSTLYADVGPW